MACTCAVSADRESPDAHRRSGISPAYSQSVYGLGAHGLAAGAPGNERSQGVMSQPEGRHCLIGGDRLMGQLEMAADRSAPWQEPTRRAALNGLLIRLRKQQDHNRGQGRRAHGDPPDTWTGRFPGRQERRWLSRGLRHPPLAQWGDAGLFPVTEAKSRANAQDRRER